MRTLYFDCFSGLSGDMVIGALIDAGADPDVLVAGLEKLHIEDEYELKWYKVIKNGITSTKFDVILHQDHGHSHDDDHHDSSHSHGQDRKSTRLNSSHVAISYAVFCLKKKTRQQFATLRSCELTHSTS